MKFINYLVIATAIIAAPVLAQTKTTELVVPYVPGGTMTNIAHLAAEALTDSGVPTIVANKPGGESVIGANYAAKAAPDGKTMLVGAGSSLAANPTFNASGIEYNENSFVPVVPLGTVGWTLYIQGNSPIKNYEQFKFYVRANPEKFTVGFWNINYAKLILAWAEKEGLPKPTIINYKGSTPAMTDVIGGHVLAGVVDLYAAQEMYKGKRINIIAAYDSDTQKRAIKIHNNNEIVDVTKTHPELSFNSWYGLWAPVGTPKETIVQLNATVNRAFKTPKYQEKISKFTLQNIGGTPEQVLAWQQRDLKLLRSVASKY